MRKNKKILVIGRHTFMLEKVCAMLIQNGYDAKGISTDTDAYQLMEKEKFDAIVIGGGVEQQSRDAFYAFLSRANNDAKIINAHPQTVLTDLQRVLGS